MFVVPFYLLYTLYQGSPSPGLWTSTGPRPVGNWVTHQEVSGGWVSEASPAFLHRSPLLTLLPQPYPPPTHTHLSVSSIKPVLGAKRFGDRCSLWHYGRIEEGDVTESAGLRVCNNESDITMVHKGECNSTTVEKGIWRGDCLLEGYLIQREGRRRYMKEDKV